MRRLFLILLLLPAAGFAQSINPGQEVCAYSVPLNSAANATLWTHFTSSAVINNPLFQCVTWTLPLGCSGGSCGGTVYLDHGGNTGPGSSYTPTWTFTDIDTTLGVVSAVGKTNNLILQGASFVNNSSTSQGLGSQGWADNLSVDGTNMNPVLFRANLTTVLPGDYICAGGTAPACTGGNYWQETNICTNLADPNDVHCILAVSPPACLTSSPGADCADGQALWHSLGAHGAPLDYWCDSNTTGNNQFDCFKLSINGTASITSNKATITVTNPQTLTAGMTGKVTGVTGTNGSNFNCGGTSTATITTPLTSTTISYTCSVALTNTSSTTLTGGTYTSNAGHSLNINTTNASLTVLQTQLPIPWELPMRIWRQNAQSAINTHYAGFTNGFTNKTYIRQGLTKAGEADTSGSNSWPISGVGNAGSNAQAMMLSYENDMYKFSKATGGGTNYIPVANLHTYGTQEAAYAAAQGLGFDNNALGVNQVTQIVLGNALVPGALPNSGDWPIAFKNYPNNLPHILQTGGRTQQGSATCYPGEVGSMAVDTSCNTSGTATSSGTTITIVTGTASSTWCTQLSSTAPSIVLNGTAYALATSGCSAGTLITQTTLPTFSSPVPWSFPYPFNITGYPGNQPVAKANGATVNEDYICDILRMTDPLYDSIGAACTQTESLLPDSYQVPYGVWGANFGNYGYQTTGTGTGSFTWSVVAGILYPLSSTSTTEPGLLTPLFNSTETSSTCTGDCLNAVKFSPWNPSVDPYTRITDGSWINGESKVGSFTGSSGDIDRQISINEDLVAVNMGGSIGIVGVKGATTGGPIQVTNTVKPFACRGIVYPFTFSVLQDNKYFHARPIKSQVGVGYVGTSAGVINVDQACTDTLLFDYMGAVPATGGFACPGIPQFTVQSNSTFVPGANDTIFTMVLAAGGQNTGTWVVSYNTATNQCSSVDWATGRYWAFTACQSIQCNSSTPPTGCIGGGTLSGGTCINPTSPTACYGASSTNGIHDTQATLDGNGVIVALHPPWTQGVCAGSNVSNQYVAWQIGTANIYYANYTPDLIFGWLGSHHSVGYSSVRSPVNNGLANGWNVRPVPGLSNGVSQVFTVVAPTLSIPDSHWSWAHPNFDDSFAMWVGATDGSATVSSLCPGGNPATCPKYPNNLLIGTDMSGVNPTNPRRVIFGPTYACGGTDGYPNCPDNIPDVFGNANAIGIASQHMFCYAVTMLHGTKQSDGTPRGDAYCVYLQ